jgi:hypothetical protein
MAITSNPTIQSGAVSTGNGTHSFLNLTTTTLVKTTPGRICTVNVLIVGSSVGTVFDHASTSGLTTANLVAVIPKEVGTYVIDFPCAVGIAVTPPPDGTISVSFN